MPGNRRRPVGTSRPSGEDDLEAVVPETAPANQVPADGEVSKTNNQCGDGGPPEPVPGKGGKR